MSPNRSKSANRKAKRLARSKIRLQVFLERKKRQLETAPEGAPNGRLDHLTRQIFRMQRIISHEGQKF